MLTALTVKTDKPRNRFQKLLNRIRGDSITTDINSVGGVVLRRVTYISRNGNVDLQKLAAEIGEAREILCDENVTLPKGCSRFDDSSFKSILSINFSVKVLSMLKSSCPDLPVGFYDLSAQYSAAIGELSHYNDNLTVVSDNIYEYKEICDAVLAESGAAIEITDNRQRLSCCRLVIAPQSIEEPLPISGSAIILSGAKPKVSLRGVCYYEYRLKMPPEFAVLKPEELSAEYFTGALYSLSRQYTLGRTVPTLCSCHGFSQTPSSLRDCLYPNKTLDIDG